MSDPHGRSGASRPSRAGPEHASGLLRRPTPDEGIPPGSPVFAGVPLPAAGDGSDAVREGPAAVRRALGGFTSYRGPRGEDLRDLGPIFDVGNVALESDDADGERIYDGARKLFERELRPLFVGGAHALLVPVLRGLLRSGVAGTPAVVVIDAHLDVREREDARSLSRGAPFQAAIRSGHLDPRRIAVLGLRSFANSRMLTEWIRESGVHLLMVDDMGTDAPDGALAGALRRTLDGADGVYVSVDLDVLDSAHGPGTLEPDPGGLTSRELLATVRTTLHGGVPLLGADVSGLAPDRDDEAGSTAKTGALALLEIAAGLSAGAEAPGDRADAEAGARQEPGGPSSGTPPGGSSAVH